MYKIFTRLIADRLGNVVDPYLRNTQFGFRKKKSTIHAIHILRRTIEGFFHKSEPAYDLNLLLLDWSKAFDRVDSKALNDALVAFGIGGKFLETIQSILKTADSESSVKGTTRRRPSTRRKSESAKAALYRHYFLSS